MKPPADTLQVRAHGATEIRITRSFDAPRELVFRALTEAELLGRWLTGPTGWRTVECSSDARVGGRYRHEWAHVDGASMAMSGTYRLLEPPVRIERSERFELGCEAQAGEQHETLTLEEEGGRTLMRIVVRYPSREARDQALASGMEDGMNESYGRLDAELDAAARS